MTYYGELFRENNKELLNVGRQLVEAIAGKGKKRKNIKDSSSEEESDSSDPGSPEKLPKKVATTTGESSKAVRGKQNGRGRGRKARK